MADEKSGRRLTKKQTEKLKEQLCAQSLEIAGMAQALIKRRIERAFLCERELDKFMEEMLRHADEVGDKSKSKAIIAKLDALKIEDVTKLSSLMKAMLEKSPLPSPEPEEKAPRQLRFEDYYDL